MCDSFIALPPATADGAVVFGKNSDRPAGEGQETEFVPARRHAPGRRLKCTYIEIAQVARTFAVLLSRIDWMWGAEMGANDQGVVIGNEAVWTTLPAGPPALLGMDLVRLGLERGATAREALGVIAALLEEHGQGGPCAENDPGFAYDNSFLIADGREAWVLETAGRHWAARRITEGVANISNRLSIRGDHELRSDGLDAGVDFAAAFSSAPLEAEPGSREAWGARLLAAERGRISPETMMAVLRDHDGGICMHGAFETTAAMVSRLGPAGEAAHWLASGPNPCRAAFERRPELEPAPAAAPASDETVVLRRPVGFGRGPL